MIKKESTIVLFILTIIFIVQDVFTQPIATRIFSDTGYRPGIPFHVAVVFTAEADVTYTIAEKHPEGWTIEDFERVSQFIQTTEQNGVISWRVTYTRSMEVILTYSAIPPTTASEVVSFHGTIDGQEITGDQLLNPRPLRPIGIFEDQKFGHFELGQVNESFGEAQYNPQTGEYILTTGMYRGGNNNGISVDLYTTISDDFVFKGKMINNNLSDDSNKYSSAAFVVWDTLQTNYTQETYFSLDRFVSGGLCSFLKADVNSSNILIGKIIFSDALDREVEMIREGNLYSLYYIDKNTKERVLFESKILPFSDPVYVGLLASHWPASSHKQIQTKFTNVELITSNKSSVNNWFLYR